MRLTLLSIPTSLLLLAAPTGIAFAQTAPAAPPPLPAPSADAAPAALPPPPPGPLPPQALPPPMPPPYPGPPPALDHHLDVATLRVLRDRGQITEAEHDAAVTEMNDSVGASVASDAPTFVLGKFSTTFYGRAKSDFIYDSTESFSDLAGTSLIARPSYANIAPPPAVQTNYAGGNSRTQFSIRDSRFGFYVRAPEIAKVRASALLEMDFFGQLASNATESQNWSTAIAPRLRHFYFKLDTPVVDLLVGQYWHLFGWQNAYHPASVQAQGLVGELYSRDLQLRISKTIATQPVTFEIAAAVLRPPQRDSGKPQGEAGLRLAINPWKGVVTNGATGTSVQPASVAVSGNLRDFTVPEMSLNPQASADLTVAQIAVDAMLPVIPVIRGKKDNALTVHGEFVTGQGGIADLYSSLTGGIGFPSLPLNGVQGAAYPQNVDNGMVTFDGEGNLKAIQWTTLLVGLQYVLPFTNGRAVLAGNYSHIESNNIDQFTQSTTPNPTVLTFASDRAVIKEADLFDLDLFADVFTGVRVGVEGAFYRERYVDGILAKDTRVQAAGIFSF